MKTDVPTQGNIRKSSECQKPDGCRVDWSFSWFGIGLEFKPRVVPLVPNQKFSTITEVGSDLLGEYRYRKGIEIEIDRFV